MQTFTDKTVNSSTTTQPFLLVSNVAKEYPTQEGVYTVLDGVELQVNEGEFVCIIGHSGCGKSTLLNMVAGFSSPSRGQVLLQDKEVKEPGPDRMMVFRVMFTTNSRCTFLFMREIGISLPRQLTFKMNRTVTLCTSIWSFHFPHTRL